MDTSKLPLAAKLSSHFSKWLNETQMRERRFGIFVNVCVCNLKLLRGVYIMHAFQIWVGSFIFSFALAAAASSSFAFCGKLDVSASIRICVKSVRGHWIWTLFVFVAYSLARFLHDIICYVRLVVVWHARASACVCILFILFFLLVHFQRCQVHFHESIFVLRISAVFLLFSLSSCFTHDCAHRS